MIFARIKNCASCLFLLSLASCGGATPSHVSTTASTRTQSAPSLLAANVTDPQLVPVFSELDKIFASVRSRPYTVSEATRLRQQVQTVLDTLITFSNRNAYGELFHTLAKAGEEAHKVIQTQSERPVQVQLALLWNDILDEDATLHDLYFITLEKEIKALVQERRFEDLSQYADSLRILRVNTSIGGMLSPLLLPPPRTKKAKTTVTAPLTEEQKQLVLDFMISSGLAQRSWYRNDALSYFLHQDFVNAPSARKMQFLTQTLRPTQKAYVAYLEWMGLPVPDDRSQKEKALDDVRQAMARVIGERTANMVTAPVGEAKDILQSMNPAKMRQASLEEKQKIDAWDARVRTELQGALTRLQSTGTNTDFAEASLLKMRKGEKDAEGWFYDFQGLKIREGDVLLLRGSSEWDSLTNAPLRFSHFITISFDKNGRPYLFDNSGDSFLTEDLETMNFAMLRNKTLTAADREKLRSAAEFYLNKGMPPYDTEFNAKDDHKMYCAELGYHQYRQANLPITFPAFQARNERILAWLREIGIKYPEFFITQASYALDPRFEMISSHSTMDFSLWTLSHNFAIDAMVRKMTLARKIDFTHLKDAYWETIMWDFARRLVPDADTRRMKSGLMRGFMNMSKGLMKASEDAMNNLEKRGIHPEEDFLFYRQALREEVEANMDIQFERVFTY